MNRYLYAIKALLQRGPRFIFMYLKESVAFDLVNGTSTHLRVPKDEQSASGERKDGVLYVASLTSVVERTLAVSRDILGGAGFDEAQFFDLGCGKGKALLVYALARRRDASSAGVGIEYESALCEIARKNVSKVRAATGCVTVHCDSAVNIERYVKSRILIVYLYNPFQGETLRAVLERIKIYPHVLIYVDPVEREKLADYGYEICASAAGRYHADTWLVATNPALRQLPLVAVE
jgi:16S rRNA G966 N2-methylase RsmD